MFLQMAIANPILLSSKPAILADPQGYSHPLIESKSLKLVAWLISGINWKQKVYHEKLQNLVLMLQQLTLKNLTNRPRNYGAAGVVADRLISFSDF